MANTEMWKSILCELLDCGYLDLQILDDADEDCVLEAIDDLEGNGIDISLNGITDSMFYRAQYTITEAVNERIDELEGDVETLSEDEQNELMEIKELNPDEDISWYCNCLDTGIYINEHEDVYWKYFKDVLDDLENKTGFCFQ